MKTRREFIRSTLLGVSASWTLPVFIQNTFGQLHQESKDLATQIRTGRDDTIFIVLQLAGGNDGLNTLIPYGDDEYYRARPSLSKKSSEIIKLSDYVGLNSKMPFLASVFDQGNLGVVQGVGYPNPNRSHFVATSIWETGDVHNASNTGWLGRYFDHNCKGSDPSIGISFGKNQPESFGADCNPGICLNTPQLYQWLHDSKNDDSAEEFFKNLNEPEMPSEGSSIAMGSSTKAGVKNGESNLDFLERVALDAQVSSKHILEIASKYKSKIDYPSSLLAKNLNLVARMIAGKMTTRVYYVSHGGFDTHNQQGKAHDTLLSDLDSALKAFYEDLKQQGNDQRVVVMTFSEFGRRVAENASKGTDHGSASCMFVMGNAVQGGLHGKYPSLNADQLIRGDLAHHIDFRSVYSGIMKDWLQAKEVNQIVGGSFDPLSIIKKI